MIDSKLREYLEGEGFKELREIPGRGICGLFPFMFTIGLVYNIDKWGYEGRYCFPRENTLLALGALLTWDGKHDPEEVWIKHKGRTGEWNYSNRKTYENA